MGGSYGGWSLTIYVQPTFDAIAAATAAQPGDTLLKEGPSTAVSHTRRGLGNHAGQET